MVSAAVTIIWGGEYGNHIAIVTPKFKPQTIIRLNEEKRSNNNGKLIIYQLYPSMTSWWALETRVRLLEWLKVSEISWPNV